MLSGSIQFNELDSFKQANSLLKNSFQTSFDEVFEQALEAQAKEESKNAKDKANEIVEETANGSKKKKENSPNTLPDITQITKNVERGSSSERTYQLLDKFKDKKRAQDEDLPKSPRQQQMENANFAGQTMFQPVADQAPRQRASKSQMLAAWEKFAPTITEDITKKAVRIDIPLINDVQAIVLRMHSDKSITASLLGSFEMGELLKQNKDKLDRNLRHHHLSLREVNAYRSELEFTSESGTKKNKKKPVKSTKPVLDIM